MPSFRGSFLHTLDEKNRLSIPAKYRKSSNSTSHDIFIITVGLDRCLFVYPQDIWENEVERELNKLSFTTGDHRLFARKLLHHATDVQLDRQGRLTLPQKLLDIAEIKKEVLIKGMLTRLEFWNPETYEKYESGSPKSLEEVAENIRWGSQTQVYPPASFNNPGGEPPNNQ